MRNLSPLLGALAIAGFMWGAIAGGAAGGHALHTPPAVLKPALITAVPATREADSSPVEPDWPTAGAYARARALARGREGLVSFAAIGPGGREIGYEDGRLYFSASASKALLLVAELRRLRRAGLPLDDATRSTLTSMITISDNDAAEQIYGRVGDPGIQEVADLAGMKSLETEGHWSNTRITAADMALFMSKLDDLLDLPGGDAGSEMLGSVIPEQSWGIPQAAPKGAQLRFKGGWRPSDTGQLVHQAARVDIGGESYAIAVLTDGNPSMEYGEATIRLIAAELLDETGH